MSTEHQKSPTQMKKPRTEIQFFKVPNPGRLGDKGSVTPKPLVVGIVNNVHDQTLCQVMDRVYLRVEVGESELTLTPNENTYWIYLNDSSRATCLHLNNVLNLTVRLRVLAEACSSCPFPSLGPSEEEDSD